MQSELMKFYSGKVDFVCWVDSPLRLWSKVCVVAAAIALCTLHWPWLLFASFADKPELNRRRCPSCAFHESFQCLLLASHPSRYP